MLWKFTPNFPTTPKTSNKIQQSLWHKFQYSINLMGKTKSPRKSSPFKVSKRKHHNEISISFEKKKEFSKVWEEYTPPDAEGKVSCKRCLTNGKKKMYLKSGGTSAPGRHLKKVHLFDANNQLVQWTKEKNEKAHQNFIRMICLGITDSPKHTK